MNVTKDNQYAICLSELHSKEKSKTFPRGSILKIQTLDEYGEFTFTDETHEKHKHGLRSDTIYKSTSIERISLFSLEIYRYVIAIRNPNDRVEFIESTEKQNFISKLKPNEPVKIPNGAFSKMGGTLRRALVRYIGFVDEIGPGNHFIVSIMRRDWCEVPNCLNDIISKLAKGTDGLTVILSAEYIYDQNTNVYPTDVKLFHAYSDNNFKEIMSCNTDNSERLTKSQSHQKRNLSSILSNESSNTKNTSKTVPEKPFNVNGKDIYVIDPTTENPDPEVKIIRKTHYEDRAAILKNTHWPECAGPQHEMLNGKFIESPSSSSTYNKPARSNTRPKSSNLLDHINHDSRNANREASPSGANSKYSSPRQPRESFNYYDNDVSHANEIEERPETFTKIPESTLGINAMVTVETDSCDPLNGVIRAIFKIGSIVMVGVELDEFISNVPLNLTDGTFSGHRFFQCPNGKALFIEAECCHKDNRFSDDFVADNKSFGPQESPIVTDYIPPISIKNLQELEKIIGKSKGIQGHHNSCYLDATLFSMFTFSHCFDSLLYRPADEKDIKHYDKVRGILRDAIVHPLRKHHFVRADRVFELRELLEQISTMTGLTNEEKDPEEFMNILMAQTLRAEPYLKFNSGQDAFFYQLFVDKNDELTLPNVQQLFEQSFKTSNIKLREVPPCLIIQMPRFGKNYKMYPRIVPSQILDITDVVEGQPPACAVCGILATTKCLDCEQELYCNECYPKIHHHHNQRHKAVDIRSDFPTLMNNQTVPRIHMDLFAVVCIETSHYVSFVKAGELPDAPWLFFDSMSDREGGESGYNIPLMVSVPDLQEWLSEDGARRLHDSTPQDKLLPRLAKRLLCDAYMCMYASRDVSMYK